MVRGFFRPVPYLAFPPFTAIVLRGTGPKPDVRMPEINGFELYNKFKSKDPNIRTLFLTALGDVEAYNTTSNKVYPVMGERHFARKPIRSGELLEQVYSIMN
jgi:FixJ family two-component response regulator